MLDWQAIRHLIREIMRSPTGANSSFWRVPLQDDLFALNIGHAEGVLRPEPVRRQGNPVLLFKSKVMALRHVHYKMGQGMKKYRALELVGNELGQSSETLRAWEKSIARDDHHMMSLLAAKWAGEFENEIDSDSIDELIERYRSRYPGTEMNIFEARQALESIRSHSLSEIRQAIRRSRSLRAKTSGT
jgi:hypothetical protein